MPSALKFGALALALTTLQGTLASAVPRTQGLNQRATNGTCPVTYVRKPWDYLTSDEKAGYLNATICLFNSPSKLEAAQEFGAVSRWDDLQYVHIINTDWVHFVGALLTWHRYYMAIHERLLRDECGYTGSMPYWSEEEAAAAGIANSTVWGPDGFGSNGAVNSSLATVTSGDGCIRGGVLENATLHLSTDGLAHEYCIQRAWDQTQMDKCSAEAVTACLDEGDDFYAMWQCLEGPHGGGHNAVGGTMADVTLSPGDPMFFMHHTWLDGQYWKWQRKNLTYSLGPGGINGTNIGLEGCTTESDCAAFMNYDGDPGNVTTLNHTLYMVGIAENLTIADVIDVRTYPSCAEYLYPEDLE